jgi:hypothetical protein
MVVHDFDVVRVTFAPAKTNAPLVVDAHAVLAAAIAVQQLESIARGRSHISQLDRAVQLP